VFLAVLVYKDARVALLVRPEGGAQHRIALVTQVVFPAVESGVPLASFQQHHTQAGLGEFLGNNSSPRACTHHNGVDVSKCHLRAFSFQFSLISVRSDLFVIDS